MGLMDIFTQRLKEDDHSHRIEIEEMVRQQAKLHFILDTHISPYTILTTAPEGHNYDPCTDEETEA